MSEDNNMDNEMEDEAEETNGTTSEKPKRQVYLPGLNPDNNGEELTFDKSAYRMFHKFQTEKPCLSFDSINLGNEVSETYPASCNIVAGTQAEKIRNNSVMVMKLSNLQKMKSKKESDDESSSESEADDDESLSNDKQPLMHCANIPHHGGINRIRATQLHSSSVCAVWNDQGKVQLWNLNGALQAIDAMEGKCKPALLNNEKPLFSFPGHQCEGFAIDWSKSKLGALASGDNRGRIHVWQMAEGGVWHVDQKPLTGHSGSVEDLQWSPDEKGVLSSCSSDGTIMLWDTRVTPTQACVCTVKKAHESDVNVIGWNTTEPFLLSGGDDGAVKVWDLKLIQYGQPVAVFKHHSAPISSVNWYAHESTIFAASGEDDQTTVWDLSLETDQIDQTEKEEVKVPPQLLFIHMGQKEVKEVRWIPELKGTLATTALDGFDIFRTISI